MKSDFKRRLENVKRKRKAKKLGLEFKKELYPKKEEQIVKTYKPFSG